MVSCALIKSRAQSDNRQKAMYIVPVANALRIGTNELTVCREVDDTEILYVIRNCSSVFCKMIKPFSLNTSGKVRANT